MKNNHLSSLIRIAMALCAAALTAVIFVPLWRIELAAPQYPEGLFLLIYPNKLGCLFSSILKNFKELFLITSALTA